MASSPSSRTVSLGGALSCTIDSDEHGTRLALKGESSAHFQHVREFRTDCDRDVALFKVEQVVAACHEGYRSCFYRQYDERGGEWKTVAKKAFDPDAVYKK